VAGTALAHEPLRHLVHERLGWEDLPARWLVRGAALAVALPLLLGLVAVSRRLGTLLAEMALPPAPAGRADFGAAPRRALLVGLQLGVLLAVLLPVLALTQPFVPTLSGAPVVLLLVTLLGISFWRSATDLQEHVRAGAEVILEALRAAGPAAEPEEVEATRGVPQVEQLLPGLGSLAELRVAAGMRADGATLGQLDLRGRTGATVVAVQRGPQCLAAPGGATRLQAGDVLAVAGTPEALASATELLRGPESPE
jgi:CPA2 family monovalent cation:H+ antiporter-2